MVQQKTAAMTSASDFYESAVGPTGDTLTEKNKQALCEAAMTTVVLAATAQVAVTFFFLLDHSGAGHSCRGGQRANRLDGLKLGMLAMLLGVGSKVTAKAAICDSLVWESVAIERQLLAAGATYTCTAPFAPCTALPCLRILNSGCPTVGRAGHG